MFDRIFAPLLVVPLALLVLAAALRIGGEGLTLDRYYLLLGAIAASIVVALQVVPRVRGDIRWMAATPVLLLALSAFGPWGASASVGRSQTGLILDRFALEGDEGRALEAGMAYDELRAEELRSRLRALENAGEIDRVLPYLHPPLRAKVVAAATDTDEAAMAALSEGLGLSRPAPLRDLKSFTANTPAALDVGGFDRALLEQGVGEGGKVVAGTGAATVSLGLDGRSIVLRVGGHEGRFDLAEAVARLAGQALRRSSDGARTAGADAEGRGRPDDPRGD